MTTTSEARASFERELAVLRPKLHRYCARMTGSAIDGEDVVQDAMVRALTAFERVPVANLEGWLFRIAHNAALDFLRRRARLEAAHTSEDPEMLVDPEQPAADPEIVAASLHTFMRLPTVQRSSVILMDVLGYPLAEICTIMDAKLPAVKSALHRGRDRLRALAREPETRSVPSLAEPERRLLERYVERFNAHDFDAIRDMLADEVRLDLVNRAQRSGRAEVSGYFSNYASTALDWRFARGFVDGRPALLVYESARPPELPDYFVVLEWDGAQLAVIRDFRYARYAIGEAEVVLAG